MKRCCKSIVALLLAALLLCSSIVTVFAEPEQKTEQTQITYGNTADLQNLTGFGSVLAQAMDDEESEGTACNVIDTQIEGKTAHVIFQTDRASKVLVAVYDEQTGRMLGSGITEVSSDAQETDVTIEIDTMPQYYLHKTFLLDKNNAALCKAFSDFTSSKAFEEFKEKTTADFSDDLVVNFDESAEDNFAVLTADSAQTNTVHVQSHDVHAGVYTLTNIDNTVRSLSAGEVLSIQDGESFYVLKVQSISVSGDTATIVEQKDVNIDDLFSYIDYDQSSSPTGEDVTYDPSSLPEGIEYKGMEPWNTPSDESRVSAQWEFLDVDENLKRSCPLLETPDWYPIGESGSTLSVKVKFSLKITVNLNFKFYYDASWAGKIRPDFWNNIHTNAVLIRLKKEIKLTGSLSVTGKLQHDFDLGKIGFRIRAGLIEVPIFLHVEANTAATLSIDVIKFPLGVQYDNDGWHNLCAKPETTLSPKFELTSEICLAIKPALKATLADIISAEIEFEMGLRLHTTHLEVDFAVVNGKKIPDKIHLCDWQKCAAGELQHYVKLYFKGLILEQEFLECDLGVEQYGKLADYCVQFDPFQFYWGIKCPRVAYRVDFTVVNKSGKPIRNMDVRSGAPDLGAKYRFNERNATDDNGKVYFFYTPEDTALSLIDPHLPASAKMYTAEFLLDGNVAATKTVTMIDEKLSVTVKVDTDKTDGGGSGHHDYTGAAPGYSDGVGSDDTPLTGTFAQGDVIQFGAYPQSEVTDLVTKDALNTVLYDLEQNDPDVWKSYGYYSGTGSWWDGKMTASDYMLYTDVYYQGGKYRAVKFTQYRPYVTGRTSSASESYQDDNGYVPDSVYWFQYEPLVWRVLDPAAGLVLCETIIDSQPYNNYVIEGNGEYWREYWSNAEMTIYASNYANSSIHSWLNEDFYNTAFTDKQKQKILSPTIQNPSAYGSQFDSADTRDPVFLLSYDDVQNADYALNTNAARQAKGSDYAKCQGLLVYPSYKCSCWWLRSAGDGSQGACGVRDDGRVSSGIYFGVYITSLGIRPALMLNLGSGISKSPKKPAVQRAAEAGETRTVQQGETYTVTQNGAVAGREYVLLVREAGAADVAAETLWYIDQQTAAGDTVTFTYVPRCSGDCTVEIIGGNAVACTVTLDAYTPPLDEEDAEEYTSRGYALEGGTVTGGGAYAEGDEVTLTATPNAYYKFIGWYDGDTLVNADASYTFTATGDVDLTAKFLKNGDVNGDGSIDAGDATLILRHVVAGTPEQDPLMRQPWQLTIADVNSSYDPTDPDCPLEDEVDAGDATLILRFLVDPDRTLL